MAKRVSHSVGRGCIMLLMGLVYSLSLTQWDWDDIAIVVASILGAIALFLNITWMRNAVICAIGILAAVVLAEPGSTFTVFLSAGSLFLVDAIILSRDRTRDHNPSAEGWKTLLPVSRFHFSIAIACFFYAGCAYIFFDTMDLSEWGVVATIPHFALGIGVWGDRSCVRILGTIVCGVWSAGILVLIIWLDGLSEPTLLVLPLILAYGAKSFWGWKPSRIPR